MESLNSLAVTPKMESFTDALPIKSTNLFDDFQTRILLVIKFLQSSNDLPQDLDTSKVVWEVPRDSSHGDLSTNAAMVLAKAAKQSPRDLAEKIKKHLEKLPEISQVSIAGPGFINATLSPEFWVHQLKTILEASSSYGETNIGKGELFNVEFVSVNPTGPMHAGHGRGAVIGDVLASLLSKIGYKVTREYYVNDAGNQMVVLARSTYLRYLQAHGRSVEESQFEGLYPGDYLITVAQKLKDTFNDKFLDQPESTWLEPIRQFTCSEMMKMIREDLDLLGVHMDVYTSERELVQNHEVDKALDTLKNQGDIYTGVLEKPKGHDLEDWEERPQTLFRTTAYGDDVDRALQKSDGTWTYFASDIAYHFNKFRRGYKNMIDIVGADHVGYVKRIQAATKAITQGKGGVEVRTCQLVNFLDNGQIVKMSKRAGTFITLKDIVERVGKDVTRFIMLTRHQDVVMDFDFAKVVEQSKDNPVFYVQYAHARCHSVLRHAHQIFGKSMEQDNFFVNADLSLLTDDSELAMIKILAMMPQQLKVAALMREPHRMASYSYDVAATFHALWNKGKENAELRFIDPDHQDITFARLALIKAVVIILGNCFNLFGVTPVQEMR